MKFLLISFLIIPFVLQAEITFRYTDPPGFGFNDTSPRSPINGNTGTTLGEQRRQVLEAAADVWRIHLDTDAPIEVLAFFEEQPCAQSNGVLASAGPLSSQRNFPGAPLRNVTYPAALVNHLSGQDRFPGRAEIQVIVNSAIDDDTGCLGGAGYYYGLDANSGNQADLLSTLTHELGHGFGMTSFVSLQSGSQFLNLPDTYSRNLLDLSNGLTWPEMTDSQRLASATNDPFLVWNGANTTAAIPSILADRPSGSVEVKVGNDRFISLAAGFGPRFPSAGISGTLILIDDGTAPRADGCEEPFINSAQLAGNIALIDRGVCNFVDKVRRAEDAGARAVVVANNVPEGVIVMGGDPSFVTRIPSLMISQAAGQQLRSAPVEIEIIPGRFPGTSLGMLQMNAPPALARGSSISHWNPSASPNLLMEPNLTILSRSDPDLTLTAFREIGWTVNNITFPNLTYQIWAEQNITSPNNERNQDADGDGISNFIEYAQATNPMDPNNYEADLLTIDPEGQLFH